MSAEEWEAAFGGDQWAAAVEAEAHAIAEVDRVSAIGLDPATWTWDDYSDNWRALYRAQALAGFVAALDSLKESGALRVETRLFCGGSETCLTTPWRDVAGNTTEEGSNG